MKEPCISIDRAAKCYAIFDGFKCIGEYKPYTNEAQAESDARAEIAKTTTKEPEIVYPSITRISVTRSSRSKRSA